MLYDAFNRPITDVATPPPPGPLVRWESTDRYDSDVSRALTPAKIDRIMRHANSGEIEDQAKLSAEIEEKNWDVAQALQTRRAAIAGTTWEVLPGDDSALGKRIAADFEDMLRTPQWDNDRFDTFQEAITYELMGALLSGFAVVEIIWGKGGRIIEGFQGIEQRHFTFRRSRRPRLVTTDNADGYELPRNKFIYHRYRARSGDPTRGGLIRPLAWLHVFQNVNIKDLLRFIERYGMPFTVAKVDENAWEKERNRLKYLIRNFGSDGGAVFTRAVELDLIEASRSNGEVFFRLLDYAGAAITKVVLGQTATSGDAAGLSKGQAQENVRVDLLQMDGAAIDATMTAQVARPWTVYNHGPQAPVPRLHHQTEPPEDRQFEAGVVKTLADAGYRPEAAQIEARFGYRLQPAPTPGGGAVALAAETAARQAPMVRSDDIAQSALSEFLDGAGVAEWFGPVQTAIAVALRGEPDEREFRRRLGRLDDSLEQLYEQMDSRAFEDVLARTIYTAAAHGQADEARQLRHHES